MKQVDVQIMGQSYLLGCPEGGEAQFQAAVGRVDAAMCKIRDSGKVRARDRIAVLAALNLAFDLESSEKFDAPDHQPKQTEESGIPVADRFDRPKAELTAVETNALNTLLVRLDQALNNDGQLI